MSSDRAGFDVVVVGAGLAGYCAALSAAEAGSRVVLIEKLARDGGSSVLSGGFFALAGTPLQQRIGVTDTADLLFDDLRRVGDCQNDEALVRAYADGQGDLYDWLCAHGAEFRDPELSSGQSVPRSHQADIPALIGSLNAHARDTGLVSIVRGRRATRLLRAPQGGAVIGVRTQTDTDNEEIYGAAVVLATGGFSRSEELLGNFAPGQAAALRGGGEGNTGDGLLMAWKEGAGFRDMGQIKGTFGTHPRTGPDSHRILLAFYLGAIIVNRAGRRFVDESASYKLIGDACLLEPEHMAFQIFDQTVMDASPPGVDMFDLRPALQDRSLMRADTLVELAPRCGLDPAVLQQTLDEYNADVDAGEDQLFGRDGLCNHSGRMVRLDRPPYYAYPSTSMVLATYCGLTITPQAQVLDVFGATIPGFFAAGEITGGFHGSAYMTGSSLGKAALFGRIAGRNAAQHAAASRRAAMVGRE
jgi:fumarate reductase flavoprotein subunit